MIHLPRSKASQATTARFSTIKRVPNPAPSGKHCRDDLGYHLEQISPAPPPEIGFSVGSYRFGQVVTNRIAISDQTWLASLPNHSIGTLVGPSRLLLTTRTRKTPQGLIFLGLAGLLVSYVISPNITQNRGVGAVGRNRTGDLLITNQLLYQLSYNSVLRGGELYPDGLVPGNADDASSVAECLARFRDALIDGINDEAAVWHCKRLHCNAPAPPPFA